MRYFTFGLDTFFEVDRVGNSFYYKFGKNKLETRFTVPEKIMELAEQVAPWEYKKEIDRRISYFTKKVQTNFG